jgi:arabinogalactan oligomer/maltooligosaccharide transport system substrate-binding protein
MRKHLLSLSVLASAVLALASCGGTAASSGLSETSESQAGTSTAPSSSTVVNDGVTHNLTVWGGELTPAQNYLKEMEAAFSDAHPETNFAFTTGAVSEADARTQILKDPANAADVAIIADDQLFSIAKAGIAQSIEDIDAAIAADAKARNSELSVKASTYNNKLCAFPVSNSNGYFLYYDSTKLSLADCDTFEGLLSAIKAKSLADGKTYKLGVPSGSGWYEDGFWHAAGYDAQRDDATGKMVCDWNSTTKNPTGVQVSESLLTLSQGQYKDYWVGAGDSALMASTAPGGSYQIIATINGTWSKDTIDANYGVGAAATDLPSWTCAGNSYHMDSVGGCKLMVVNSYSAEIGWAVRFADFVTSASNQVIRYNELAEAPTNTVAAGQVDTSKNYAVAALGLQGAHAFTLNATDEYWNAVPALFNALLSTGKSGDVDLVASGAGTANLTFNETGIQAILDQTVAAIV